MVELFGAVEGEVDAALMAPNCIGGSVYVFSGDNATPNDIDRGEGDPISSTLVRGDIVNGYYYYVGFLEPGVYTLAFVCADGTTDGDPADNPDEEEQLIFTLADDTATVLIGFADQVDFSGP